MGQQSPVKSNLVCQTRKEVPSCIAPCPCRMYRVLNSIGIPIVCIHVGIHDHPVGKGICRDLVHRTTSSIGQEVSKTPIATNSAIRLAASKEFLASELFGEEGLHNDQKPLCREALEVVMDKFRLLGSPTIRNTISSFRHNTNGGPIDNIISLKMKNTYSFIQDSVFPCQGKDKVYLFKISEEGLGSGVNLVRRMQSGGDLQNSWCMFDHIKRVKGWTSMDAHVYDLEFCRVQTICVCDMIVRMLSHNNKCGDPSIPSWRAMGFHLQTSRVSWLTMQWPTGMLFVWCMEVATSKSQCKIESALVYFIGQLC